MNKFYSTKTYGSDVGISCTFRQWRAKSHCSKLHGYSLGFKFTFGCEFLDENGWVVDFGSLKDLKNKLIETFDHKTLVSRCDPELTKFKNLHESGVIDLNVVDCVGCEAFAMLAFNIATDLVETCRVWVESVEVSEHGSNSALIKRGWNEHVQ